MDKRWKNWLKENIERGCNAGELRDILLKNKFSLNAIKAAMGNYFPSDEDSQIPKPSSDIQHRPDYGKLHQVCAKNILQHAYSAQFNSPLIQLFTIDAFMDDEECDALASLALAHCRPSSLTVYNGDDEFRTSSTSDLIYLKDKIISMCDLKIATALGINLAYSEGIQAQRYEVGQQFKAHTDCFKPGTPEFEKFGAERGNRTWTFMVYLNDVVAGGGTEFPTLKTTFIPRKGKAVIWNNLHADGTPNANTLHSGLPVEEGEKIIITKWFRENGQGAMFIGQN